MNEKRAITLLLHKIDLLTVKHALLYWDSIEIPEPALFNNDLRFSTNLKKIVAIDESIGETHPIQQNDLDYLTELGVLSRPLVAFPSELNRSEVDILLEKEVAIQFFLMSSASKFTDNYLWTLGFTTDQDSIFEALCATSIRYHLPKEVLSEYIKLRSSSIANHKVDIELYNMFPSPAEVSFEDILEFKLRRNDEIVALRAAMDQLYIDVITSNDIPRSKHIAIKKLESILRDLNLVATESWKNTILSSLKIELNAPNIAVNALAGASTSMLFDVSPELGAALGAFSSMLRFEVTLSNDNIFLQERIRDFSYVFHAAQELKVRNTQ